jgi:hypothetical protein
VKAVAIGECVLVRAGYSEGGALVGVGEVVMLDIMALRDDNGWQAGVTSFDFAQDRLCTQ